MEGITLPAASWVLARFLMQGLTLTQMSSLIPIFLVLVSLKLLSLSHLSRSCFSCAEISCSLSCCETFLATSLALASPVHASQAPVSPALTSPIARQLGLLVQPEACVRQECGWGGECYAVCHITRCALEKNVPKSESRLDL